MKKLIVIASLFVTGCASIDMQQMPQTPLDVAKVQSEVRKEMSYEYFDEYNTGKDVWTAGCPSKGDCEDVALCILEKLRKAGQNPQLYILKWNSWRTPWTHVMTEKDGWFIDYKEATQTPELKRTMQYKCNQLTHDGEAWSAKGLWQCVPVKEGRTFIKKVN